MFSGCLTPAEEADRAWRRHAAADAISHGDWGHLSAVDGGPDEAVGRVEPEHLGAHCDGRPDWRDRIVTPRDS